MAGTSNFSSRKQNEIVQFVENDSSLRVIESKYQCIGVKDIQQETDFSACIVKGKAYKLRDLFATSVVMTAHDS